MLNAQEIEYFALQRRYILVAQECEAADASFHSAICEFFSAEGEEIAVAKERLREATENFAIKESLLVLVDFKLSIANEAWEVKWIS